MYWGRRVSVHWSNTWTKPLTLPGSSQISSKMSSSEKHITGVSWEWFPAISSFWHELTSLKITWFPFPWFQIHQKPIDEWSDSSSISMVTRLRTSLGQVPIPEQSLCPSEGQARDTCCLVTKEWGQSSHNKVMWSRKRGRMVPQVKTEVCLSKEVEGSWERKTTDVHYASYPELPWAPQETTPGFWVRVSGSQHFMRGFHTIRWRLCGKTYLKITDPNAHSGTDYKSQGLEATQVPINRWMDKEDVLCVQWYITQP